MNSQEIADFKKQRHDTTQNLIRVAINGMKDEKRGRLTTRGIIATLQDAIDFLEKSALSTDPEAYLDKPES